MTIHVISTPSKGKPVLLEKYLVVLVVQISDLLSFLSSLLLLPCRLWPHFKVFNHDWRSFKFNVKLEHRDYSMVHMERHIAKWKPGTQTNISMVAKATNLVIVFDAMSVCWECMMTYTHIARITVYQLFLIMIIIIIRFILTIITWLANFYKTLTV